MTINNELYYGDLILENNNRVKSYKNICIENCTIDIVGLFQYISKLYFLYDRTILNEVKRELCYKEKYLNQDYKRFLSFNEYFEYFIDNVKNEVYDVIKNKNNIGILLSGGIDSRIIALFLHILEDEKIISKNITIINWGIEGSRDVEYAKRISTLYKWNYINLPINEETLRNNISIIADHGCESSPIHIHAIGELSKYKCFDIILVGTYGDAIGRGEYSQKSIENIRNMKNVFVDKYGIIRKEYKKYYIEEFKNESNKYFANELNSRIDCELDYILNYLRRAFLPIFEILSDNIPIYQVFTNLELIKSTINADVKFRGNKLYYEVIKKLDKRLLEIPWSRTGLKYYINEGESDKYKKNFHRYGYWIRNNLSEEISKEINSGALESLKIFDMKMINYIINTNKKYSNYDNTNRVDEIILWLASLSKMVSKNNITIENKLDYKSKMNISKKLYTSLYLLTKRFK